MDQPLVSIILPVYNAENSLFDALNSVCKQTYKNLQIIVINDGSTDKSYDSVKNLIELDSRIEYFSKLNEGLIKTLNMGISLSKGDLIARMDADDICTYDRIQIQVDYMLNNLSVGLLGSAIDLFGERDGLVFYETDPSILKLKLFFQNQFAHPSVMIRKKVLTDNNLYYSEEFLHVEDYALWCKMVEYCDIANLDTALLNYRVSKSSVSASASKKIDERNTMHYRVYAAYFNSFKIRYTNQDIKIHRAISVNSPYYFSNFKDLDVVEKWLMNLKKSLYNNSAFINIHVDQVIREQYLIGIEKFSCHGLKVVTRYLFMNPFGIKISLKSLIKLSYKCLIRYKPKGALSFEDN